MSAMSLPSESPLISPTLNLQSSYPVSHLSFLDKAAEATAADGSNVSPYSHAELKVRADCRTIHGDLFGSTNFTDPLSSHGVHRSSSDQQTILNESGPVITDPAVRVNVNLDSRSRPFPLQSPFKYQPRRRECQSNIDFHSKRRSWLPSLMQPFWHHGAQSDVGRDSALPRRRLTYTIPASEMLDVVDITAGSGEEEDDLQWPVAHITCKKWAEGVARAATRSWHSEPTRQKSRLWFDFTDSAEESSIEEACIVKISASPDRPRVTAITRSRSTTSTAITSFFYDTSSEDDDQAASAALESVSSPTTLYASASQSDLPKEVFEQPAPSPTIALVKPPQTKLEAINEILCRVRTRPIKIASPSTTPSIQEKQAISRNEEVTLSTVVEPLPRPASIKPIDSAPPVKLLPKPTSKPPPTPASTATSPIKNPPAEPELILEDLATLLTSTKPFPRLKISHPLIHRIQRLNTQYSSSPPIDPPAIKSLHRIFPHAPEPLLCSLYSTLLALKFVESLSTHPEPISTRSPHRISSAPNAIPSKALLMLGLDRKTSTPQLKQPTSDDSAIAERNARRRAMKAKAEIVRVGLETELEKTWAEVMGCVYDTTPLVPKNATDTANSDHRRSAESEKLLVDRMSKRGGGRKPEDQQGNSDRYSTTSSRYTSLSSLLVAETTTDESEWMYGGVCFHASNSAASIIDEPTSTNINGKRETLRSRGENSTNLVEALEAAVAEVVRLGEVWVAEAEAVGVEG